MSNSRYPQLSSRAPLAQTVMCRHIVVAHSVMASGIDKALFGFVVLSGDPGGDSGM